MRHSSSLPPDASRVRKIVFLLILLGAAAALIIWTSSRAKSTAHRTASAAPSSIISASRQESAKVQRRPDAPATAAQKQLPQAHVSDFDARRTKTALLAAEQALLARHPKLAGKLERRLITAFDQLEHLGEEQVRTMMKEQGVIFADHGADVALIISPEEGADPAAMRGALEQAGIRIIRQDEHTLKAAVPLAKLDELAAVPGLSEARTLKPPRETNTVLTQGRTATLASNWNTGGATGAGGKIAIVDRGFVGYTTLVTQGELPAGMTTVNYAATAIDADSDHGTSCAEVIYDLSPGAQLVLIKIDDPTDLVTAASYCAANAVKVVSCSLAYDGMNFHDGQALQNWFSSVASHPVTAVNNAAANDILWVNAAGNERRQQTVIDWVDTGSDGSLDWATGGANLNVLWYYNPTTQTMTTSVPAGVMLDVIMTWNQWPTTNQDFDLALFKNTGSGWTPVTTGFVPGWNGQDPQTGASNSYPYEEILYMTTDATAQYAVLVGKYSATTAPKFILRYYGVDEPQYFGYNNTATPPAGSIAIPGDAAAAFTVGALDWNTYTTGTIEPYSSLGPNNRAFTGGTAVTKPDVCGPVWVNTVTDGTEGFGGTSAATPHIAGLAALARAAYPAMTIAQTRTYLEGKAVDRGTAGKDNTYGAGAGRLTSEAPPVVLSINRNGASPAAPGSTVQFDVTFSKSVTGGTTGNYQLVTSGVSGASITGLSGSGATRSVTVNTGSGTGSVGLNMTNSTGVADVVTNAVASLPFTGQSFTISGGPEIAVSRGLPLPGDIPDGYLYADGFTLAVGQSMEFYLTINNTGSSTLSGLGVTIDGAHASDYSAAALSATTLAPGGSMPLTITYSPSAPGTRTAAVHIASNDANENPFDITFSGTAWTQIEGWRYNWFSTISNNGNAADTFDYDLDGLANMLEFAFGLDPTLAGSMQLPQAARVGGNFVITFTQPSGVGGITYGAEWSTTPSNNPVDWTAVPDTGTPPQHIFSIPLSGSDQKFLRLKVTSP